MPHPRCGPRCCWTGSPVFPSGLPGPVEASHRAYGPQQGRPPGRPCCRESVSPAKATRNMVVTRRADPADTWPGEDRASPCLAALGGDVPCRRWRPDSHCKCRLLLLPRRDIGIKSANAPHSRAIHSASMDNAPGDRRLTGHSLFQSPNLAAASACPVPALFRCRGEPRARTPPAAASPAAGRDRVRRTGQCPASVRPDKGLKT